MISSVQFYDLLDNLAGQFFSTKSARCTGKDFGLHISSAAQEFFSIAIIDKPLPSNRLVLGVLSNDSAKIASRNGYTFTIYIDTRKFEGSLYKIIATMIIAHEICHFAFYYELFLWIGDNTGTRVQNQFTYHLSDNLIDSVTNEKDNTSQSNIDEHNLQELIENFGKYNKKHFAKSSSTTIEYHGLFHSFLNRLGFDKLIQEYKQSQENS